MKNQIISFLHRKTHNKNSMSYRVLWINFNSLFCSIYHFLRSEHRSKEKFEEFETPEHTPTLQSRKI